MNLKNSKVLGSIGALMILCEASILLGIRNFDIPLFTGFIVILISLYSLANFYQSKRIFTDARLGALVAIASIIMVKVSAGIRGVLKILSTLPDVTPSAYTSWGAFLTWVPFIAGVFLAVAAFFVWRSLKELSKRSNVSLFATSGLLLLIGAIISIILVLPINYIGYLIMWLAFLLLAIAFFKLKDPKATTPLIMEKSQPPTQTYQTTTEINYCPNCGTPAAPNATFCTHCGKQV